jgi:hypothetical protein
MVVWIRGTTYLFTLLTHPTLLPLSALRHRLQPASDLLDLGPQAVDLGMGRDLPAHAELDRQHGLHIVVNFHAQHINARAPRPDGRRGQRLS